MAGGCAGRDVCAESMMGAVLARTCWRWPKCVGGGRDAGTKLFTAVIVLVNSYCWYDHGIGQY